MKVPGFTTEPDAAGSAREQSRFLEEMARTGRQEINVAGMILRPGSRVRLRPRAGGDPLGAALDGRTALIEGIDEDDAGAAHVAVMVEGYSGRDLCESRHPAHRFFFAPDELEPLKEGEGGTVQRRVLVAGIGNVFHGDDGFGVAVAQLLFGRSLPEGVEITDFGIRGMDLAYALGRGYDAAILVDALPRGCPPGTIHVIEPEKDVAASSVDSHRMDPVAVLGFARQLGQLPRQLLIVGCEPAECNEKWTPDLAMNLSVDVARSVEKAADMVMDLAAKLAAGHDPEAALN